MTDLVIQHDATGTIIGFRYPANDYELGENELALDPAEWDHREFIPPGCKRVDTSTDPPTIEDNPDHAPPDPLDRSEIDPTLIDTYREARDVYLAERENFIDAKQADDVQGQLDALASLAENATVPALDALFQVAMGEEP